MKCRWHAVVRLLGLAVAGIYYAAASGNLAGVQDSAAGVGLAAPSQRVTLEYQETTNNIYRHRVPIRTRQQAFKHEPTWVHERVFRGYLEIGSATNDHLPLVWDSAGGKLQLDLNRNEDLTDDPKGAFTLQGRFNQSSIQFTNIHLACQVSREAWGSYLDLLLLIRSDNIMAYMTLRSLWTGKARLNGRDWQVGWIEGLTNSLNVADPQYLLLRPWEARTEAVHTDSGWLEAFRFNRRFYWGNQSYELASSYEMDGATPRRVIEFKPQQAPKLGELKIEGTMIDRLMLQGEPYSVVLDAPPPVVRIPVGSYAYARVQLRTNQARAWSALPHRLVWMTGSERAQWLIVGESQPTVLAVGGPLTNMVTFSGTGHDLALNYVLQGAGGANYRLSRWNVPPRWTVYQGRRELASGAFEFG